MITDTFVLQTTYKIISTSPPGNTGHPKVRIIRILNITTSLRFELQSDIRVTR